MLQELNAPSHQQSANHHQILLQKIEDSYQKIRALIDPSLNNFYILEGAIREKIAHQPVTKSTWRLGYGKHSRIFESTMTDQTPAWSVKTAKNKKLTASYLGSLGFPASQHVLIDRQEQLEEAIAKIGYPLVIKPMDSEQGNGVSANLCSKEDVLIAFNNAQQFSKKTLVEKHQPGFTHRLTLLNHQVIKVVKRIAGGVVGDGKHNITELVEKEWQTSDYQRKSERRGKKTLLAVDTEAHSLLKQYGLTPDYVPADKEYIRLRRRDNINAGGRSEEVDLVDVHNDNVELVKNISECFNFDIVGIDLIIEDISQSWQKLGATVCEVNAQPQLGASKDPHLYPQMFQKMLIDQGMIPIDLVVNESSGDILTIIHHSNFVDSVIAHQSGLHLGQKLISRPFTTDFLATQAALAWKNTDSVTCVISLGELLKHGLPLYHAHIRHVYLADQFLSSEELIHRFHFSPNQFKSL
jgi:cyanophycin synthetase